MNKIIMAYLTRKGISMDLMLRSLMIFNSIVNIKFFELVSVSQGTSRNIDMMLCVLLYPEHKGLTCVL